MDVRPARFFDGRQANGHVVAVGVEDGQVVIRSDAGSVTWTLREVAVRVAPDGVASLSRGRDPARLMVADPVLLQALRAGVRRWPRRQSGWKVAVAAGGALLGAAALLVTGAPAALTPFVPLTWEAPIGRHAEAALLARHGRCTGTAGQRALDRLAARLAQTGGIIAPVHVAVADDPLVNAFTLPGNRVLLMRGLIAATPDGDELAGVLAHELGHVAHRDAVRQLLRQLGLSAVAAAFGWGNFDGGGIATTLLGLSYGRAAEADADAFAITTLRGAGLRADGLGRFFIQVEKDGPPGLAFLSDHPPTADRAARARQTAEGDEAMSVTEWQAVRTMCKP